MNLKDINIKGSYTGKGTTILNDFLIPALNSAVSYDRITGYFTIDSLLSIANGIDSLRRKNGKMRLIVGIHSIPEDIIEATINIDTLKSEILSIQHEIDSNIKSLSEELEKQKIATIAWMIDCGLLTIKAAAVKGDGIFHPKTIIIKDCDDNEVVAVGSSNETRNGLGGNFEQLMVATSWSNEDAVKDQKKFFDSLWNNNDEDAVVFDITHETAKMIKNSLGKDYERLIKLLSNQVTEIFKHLSEMPVNYFISGNIPALYMHQERAVLDALSRWPVRVLFSDEVGLGKTFEAAATLAFLNKYCGVKRILILTPKSVLQQWQDELKAHFGLNVWLYDSNKKEYLSSNNDIIKIGNSNPLGRKSPDIMLMSAQYARGNKQNNGLLSEKDSVLPELLVVDEAHSARITEDLSGKKQKTQMYKMLENISRKIPHIILATATPMQKKASEYHALLKILGLPKTWKIERNFLNSLQYIMKDEINDLSDSYKILSLLHDTYITMKPDLSILTSKEIITFDNAMQSFELGDKFDNSTFVEQNWHELKNVFIKLHPARLLTVRNTRKSLMEIGYKFPKRNLHEKALYDSDKIKLFYSKVNKYLTEECFSVEKELNANKKLNTAFIQISYQQRVASSLYSCKMSLERRLAKIEQIQNKLESHSTITNIDIDESYKDDFDIDDLLNMDLDGMSNDPDISSNMDNLRRAVNKEYFSLKSLVIDVNDLIKYEGDKKIDESIKLALENLESGDSVLLFSRYTDTVDALISSFNDKNYDYAIYTGNRSLIVKDGIEKECNKEQIKKSLFSKEIRIVFCSDAASEGINLQAARILINVDVPWTPARLEQRIGRIARLGQVADEVDIYNVWYPHSVEAKMYQRIQKRLKNTNIAIGEFPDVVAESIKSAILNDTDDNSLELLKSIRNNIQKNALNQLWSESSKTTSQSDMLRNKLIDICKTRYTLLNEDVINNYYTFKSKDNTETILSTLPGRTESINLKSQLLYDYNTSISGINILNTGAYETGLIDTKNNKIIKTESILNQTVNANKDFEYYDDYPVTLPNPNKLDLSYSVDEYQDSSPIYLSKNKDF